MIPDTNVAFGGPFALLHSRRLLEVIYHPESTCSSTCESISAQASSPGDSGFSLVQIRIGLTSTEIGCVIAQTKLVKFHDLVPVPTGGSGLREMASKPTGNVVTLVREIFLQNKSCFLHGSGRILELADTRLSVSCYCVVKIHYTLLKKGFYFISTVDIQELR